MFGSYQEALRLPKLAPENGTEPSDLTLKATAGGPWVAGRRLDRGCREVLFKVGVEAIGEEILRDEAEGGAEDEAGPHLPGDAKTRLEVVQILRSQGPFGMGDGTHAAADGVDGI